MTSIFGGAQSVPTTQNTFQTGSQNGSQASTQAVGTAETGVTTQMPGPYAQAAGANLYGQVNEYLKYPGNVPLQGTADLNSGQNEAIGGIQQTGMTLGQNLPFLGASYLQSGADRMADAGNPLTGEEVAGFYNPMADNVTAQMMNIFGQQNLANRMGMTAKTGGVGGDRAAVGQALLANQQGLAAGQTYAGLYGQALNAAQQQKAQQMGAGQGLASLGLPTMGAGLQGMGSALTAASIPQALEQQKLSSLYAQQQGQYEDPYRRIQASANAIPGIVAGTGMTQTSGVQRDALSQSNAASSQNSTQTGVGAGQTTYPAPSVLSQVAGLGSLGAGLFGLFSDERAKTDIEKVGKNPETGLTDYAFRYKNDPKTYPKVVGPMAQDVQKEYPAAVKEYRADGGEVEQDYDEDANGASTPAPDEHEQNNASAKAQAQSFQKRMRAVQALLQGDKKLQKNLPGPAPIKFPVLQFARTNNYNNTNAGYASGGEIREGEYDKTGRGRTTSSAPPKPTADYSFDKIRRANDKNQKPGAEPGVYARGGRASDGGRVRPLPFVQGFAPGGEVGDGGFNWGWRNGSNFDWGAYAAGNDPGGTPAYGRDADIARMGAANSIHAPGYVASMAPVQNVTAYPATVGEPVAPTPAAATPLPGALAPTAFNYKGTGSVGDPNLWRAPNVALRTGSAPNSGAGVNPGSQAGNYFHYQPGGSLPNWQNAAGRVVPRAEGGSVDEEGQEPTGLPDPESMEVSHEPAGNPSQAGEGGYGDYDTPPEGIASGTKPPPPGGAPKGPPGVVGGPAAGGGGNAASMALIQAGLGMLAASGQRDGRGLPMSGLAAIGQGGMAGMKTYQGQQQLDVLNRRKQQDLGLAQQRIAETQRHNKALERYYYGAKPENAPAPNVEIGPLTKKDVKAEAAAGDAPDALAQGGPQQDVDPSVLEQNPGIAKTIRAVAEGRQNLATIPMRQRKQIMDLTHQYDPSFDQSTYNARAALRRDVAVGNSGKMLLAVNQLLPHINTASEKAEALDNAGYPAANTIKNWWLTATGDERVKEFNTVKHVAATDAARLLRGSGAMALADIEFWDKAIKDSDSPAQLQKNLKLLADDLMGARVTSIEHQWRQTMKSEPPQFVSGEAKAALQGVIERADKVGRPKSEAKPSAPAPSDGIATPKSKEEYDALPSGTQYMKDGQLRTKK